LVKKYSRYWKYFLLHHKIELNINSITEKK
jgi:hypothetical protein